MATDTKITGFVINQLTETQLANATIAGNQIWATTDEETDDAKANVDASNLNSSNITSWRNVLGANAEVTELWRNNNPMSSFSSQTITLSSSDWDYIAITFQAYDSQASRATAILSKDIITLNSGYEQSMIIKWLSGSVWNTAQARRNYTFTAYNKINFGSGDKIKNGDGGSSSSDYFMVPLLILGVKV